MEQKKARLRLHPLWTGRQRAGEDGIGFYSHFPSRAWDGGGEERREGLHWLKDHLPNAPKTSFKMTYGEGSSSFRNQREGFVLKHPSVTFTPSLPPPHSRPKWKEHFQ